METKAHAKVNLGLWVIGQRPDGYHSLLTVLHLVELHDELSITPSDSLRVICGPDLSGPANLAHKAVEGLGRLTGKPPGVQVDIRKNIPVGGGLGGGSADAGAVLRALGPGLPREKLLELAAELGSDVPFFASGMRVALAAGRGEKVQEVESALKASLLLYVPRAGVDTGQAYAMLRKERAYVDETTARKQCEAVLSGLRAGDLHALGRGLFNSFEGVVFRDRPELARARDRLLGMGAVAALLSGSGGVVYGLFPEDANLPDEPPGDGKWTRTRLL